MGLASDARMRDVERRFPRMLLLVLVALNADAVFARQVAARRSWRIIVAVVIIESWMS